MCPYSPQLWYKYKRLSFPLPGVKGKILFFLNSKLLGFIQALCGITAIGIMTKRNYPRIRYF